jgi:hypothetical protein
MNDAQVRACHSIDIVTENQYRYRVISISWINLVMSFMKFFMTWLLINPHRQSIFDRSNTISILHDIDIDFLLRYRYWCNTNIAQWCNIDILMRYIDTATWLADPCLVFVARGWSWRVGKIKNEINLSKFKISMKINIFWKCTMRKDWVFASITFRRVI